MATRGQLEFLRHAPTTATGSVPQGQERLALSSERTERAIARARLLAQARGPKVRLAYARAFCANALERYWTKLPVRPAATLRARPEGIADSEIRAEGVAAASELGEVAALLPIDDASYLVGRTYAAMLPEDFRSANGVFYTPPAIVERLLDSVAQCEVDWSRCRALDPACGGGAFLGPAVRRMAQHLRGAERRLALKNLSERLRGFEIDPFSAWMSAVFLDATLYEELGFTFGAVEVIEVCDSLSKSDAANEFDLVIGNPPYGRVGLTAAQRKTFGRSLYGHANLYGVFLDLALRHTKPGGVIAYVTPTGFLAGNYFKNLRALLGKEGAPVCLDFISQREGVFDDVLQETLLAVFRKGERGGAPDVNFIEIEGGSLRVRGVKAIPLPRPLEQPWIFPRSPEDAEFVEKLRGMSSRLCDWGYKVSTGPLVWNRHKAQLVTEARRGAVPLIWAESVSADGEFEFRHERRNHAPYFVPRADDKWLLVSRPSVLVQRTTAKEQSRRLIAAELPQSFLDAKGGAVTVENHLNMVLPQASEPPVSPRALAAFLNSSVADRVFRCISGTVAVSAYELEAMPLPAPWALRELEAMLSRKQTTKSAVDEYCRRLYGDK